MKESKEILSQIISKGGLIGLAAKKYINDEAKAHEFIIECSEQCHNGSAKRLWGSELVSDIEEYVKLEGAIN